MKKQQMEDEMKLAKQKFESRKTVNMTDENLVKQNNILGGVFNRN